MIRFDENGQPYVVAISAREAFDESAPLPLAAINTLRWLDHEPPMDAAVYERIYEDWATKAGYRS